VVGGDTWARLADQFADVAYASVKGQVRTYVLHQQLLAHLQPPPAPVLDVGGGAGHQIVGWVDGSWVEGQAGVGQEPDDEAVALADAPDALFGGVGDLGQGGRGPIRELDILEVGRQLFHGVELGA
jgi:hypothetical protein